MPKQVIEAGRRPAVSLANEISEYTSEGTDVILTLGDSVNPERIIKILECTIGDSRVRLVVRHAELDEYIENAFVGAAIGGAAGAGAAIVFAILAGNPVTGPVVLSAAGLGAATGAIIGLGSTAIALVTIYKTSGETRMRYEAA